MPTNPRDFSYQAPNEAPSQDQIEVAISLVTAYKSAIAEQLEEETQGTDRYAALIDVCKKVNFKIGSLSSALGAVTESKQ